MARKLNFSASDGKSIHYYAWIPRAETDAVVMIIHGMAEHGGRYDKFAKFLNGRGFSVYAPDLRGHGETIAEPSEQGFFAEENGWFRVVADLEEFVDVIREREGDKPIVVLGHSMGSLMARSLLILHPDLFHAAVLLGTAASPGLLGKAGRVLARIAVRKNGPRFPNKRLDQMSFGAYAKPFEPARTKFDWITRDPDEVDSYIDDPLCGFVMTSKFYIDLLDGLDFIHNRRKLLGMKMDLPVLILSGSRDPVGDMGKGVRKVAQMLKEAGMKRLDVELYEGARHNLVHETNHREVEEHIEAWIRGTLG